MSGRGWSGGRGLARGPLLKEEIGVRVGEARHPMTTLGGHRLINEQAEKERSERTSSSYSSGPASGSKIRGRTFSPNAGFFESETVIRSFSEPSIAGWPSTMKAQFLGADINQC